MTRRARDAVRDAPAERRRVPSRLRTRRIALRRRADAGARDAIYRISPDGGDRRPLPRLRPPAGARVRRGRRPLRRRRARRRQRTLPIRTSTGARERLLAGGSLIGLAFDPLGGARAGVERHGVPLRKRAAAAFRIDSPVACPFFESNVSINSLPSPSMAKAGSKRSLGAVQLTSLGIGAIIGAGIFSTVGTAAAGGAEHVGAGPALISPSSSSRSPAASPRSATRSSRRWCRSPARAYTYAYATLGELVAWIIGWDLIIEYAVGNVAVAISLVGLLPGAAPRVRPRLPGLARRPTTGPRPQAAQHRRGADGRCGPRDPRLGVERARAVQTRRTSSGIPIIFNLPAVLIVALITWVLVRRHQRERRLNTVDGGV